jgi:DNA-binding Xre family transcriptional regulator
MEKTNYRGVSRVRRLTTSEAAKYRRIRKQVEKELPPSRPAPAKFAIAKLRALRQARGMSLSELAARAGMTRGNPARLESQKSATLRTLERYATGLDCQLEINLVSVEMQMNEKRKAVVQQKNALSASR